MHKQEADENMMPVRQCISVNVYQLNVFIRRPVVMVIILRHLLCHGTMLKASQINS